MALVIMQENSILHLEFIGSYIPVIPVYDKGNSSLFSP